MALPKITTPLIPLELPYSNKKLVIRQFITKEYKTAMSAVNTDHEGIITETLSKIIQDCVVEPENFNINDLPAFEVEYLFLQLYLVSVKGTIDISLNCSNLVDKEVIEEDEDGIPHPTGKFYKDECGATFNLSINASEIYISDAKPSTFTLSDNIILKLKYPTWKDAREMLEQATDIMRESGEKNDDELSTDEMKERMDMTYKMIYKAFHELWVNDELYTESFTEEEFLEWIDTFPADVIKQLIEFVSELPQATVKREVTCPKCGKKETFVLSGLNDYLK